MKKLLFVCSGNSCRSPMAMAIAAQAFGGRAVCDSAAGNFVDGRFKASKSVSRNAVQALQKLYDIDISAYCPKPLSHDLVESADWIFFLGQQFWDNGMKAFPAYKATMTYYASYENLLAPPAEQIEIPDPFDGQWWPNFYSSPWPGKKLDSYEAVAKSMMNTFQRQLSKRFVTL